MLDGHRSTLADILGILNIPLQYVQLFNSQVEGCHPSHLCILHDRFASFSDLVASSTPKALGERLGRKGTETTLFISFLVHRY